MTANSREDTPSTHPAGARIWPWFVTQLGLAGGLCWINRDVLNHDGIAYLRIAEYYATWDTERMISGYWGPLLSWLMALGFKLGFTQMLCARLVMMLSATVFLAGGGRLLNAFNIKGSSRQLGLALFAISSATWSAQNISPDVLMAGLALWGLALFYEASKTTCWRAGIFWGLAYLAKPIALPWVLLVLGAAAVKDLRRSLPNFRRGIVPGAVLLLIVGPWITVLSLKYGHVTISTSGPIAHTLAGPTDVDRYHPTFVTLHQPEPGRITSWEDPTNLGYRPWSPFASGEYLRHQVTLVAANTLKVLFIITTLVPFWPWVVRKWLRTRSFDNVATPLLLSILLLALIYLPVYLTANEQRYFYVSLPLLWCAFAVASPTRLRLGFAITLFVTIASIIRFSYPPRVANQEAHALAGWLQAQGKSGPVAGSGLQRGGRTGLFLAWHLRQPWLGDDSNADALKLAKCGARLLVLRSDDARLAELKLIEGAHLLALPAGLTREITIVETSGNFR